VSIHNRLEQNKTLPSGSPTGLRRWSMGGTAGDLGGPSRVRDGFAYRKISFPPSVLVLNTPRLLDLIPKQSATEARQAVAAKGHDRRVLSLTGLLLFTLLSGAGFCLTPCLTLYVPAFAFSLFSFRLPCVNLFDRRLKLLCGL
jgi:hypothetical protein